MMDHSGAMFHNRVKPWNLLAFGAAFALLHPPRQRPFPHRPTPANASQQPALRIGAHAGSEHDAGRTAGSVPTRGPDGGIERAGRETDAREHRSGRPASAGAMAVAVAHK
jgi:hypothetical protein